MPAASCGWKTRHGRIFRRHSHGERARRPKLARAVSGGDIREIITLLVEAAIWVDPVERINDCRDHKDNIYLDLAAASQADVIVSSDSDR